MASGSKYETMAAAKNRKIEMLSDNVEDIIRQKQLEAEMARIEEDMNREIEEVKNTPIDTNMQIRQAEDNLTRSKASNARNKNLVIERSRQDIISAERQLESLKKTHEMNIEFANEEEARRNLEAEQEFERLKAAAGSVEKSMEIKISKIKQAANERKRNIEINLSNITIRNEAKANSLKEVDALYNDIKEISLKLGDQSK